MIHSNPSEPSSDAPHRAPAAAAASQQWCAGAPSARTMPVTAANRYGLDYMAEAVRLGTPPVPIIDLHAHIGGERASLIYLEVARRFGVQRVYTMVPLSQAAKVRENLGEFVRFIAFANFRAADREAAFRQLFLDDIRSFHGEFGARIVKFWNAPRFRELYPPEQNPDLTDLDSTWRIRQAEVAAELGMMFMVHVADPDTWFRTRYADAKIYKQKIEHYAPLERMIRRFPRPWILAHMGGFPEDLKFLDGLLSRHENLYLDSSATKWVVRELSAHPAAESAAFLTKWRSRIMFGSDIVTIDDHLAPSAPPKPGERPHPMAELADSPESAAVLYASRYYALRLMFETRYEGESPIADPDLMMVDPTKHNGMSAPTLRGLGLSVDHLRDLYCENARRIVEGAM